MSNFAFKGRNGRGELVEGIVDAASSDAVAAQLMAGGVVPVSIEPTAEAVSTGFAAGLHASYFGNDAITPEHIALHVAATALKDAADDLKKVRHYFNHVVKDRAGAHWSAYYAARKMLD